MNSGSALEANARSDWNQLGGAEAVGLGGGRRVQERVARLGKKLGMAAIAAVHAAQAMVNAEPGVAAPLVRGERGHGDILFVFAVIAKHGFGGLKLVDLWYQPQPPTR